MMLYAIKDKFQITIRRNENRIKATDNLTYNSDMKNRKNLIDFINL